MTTKKAIGYSPLSKKIYLGRMNKEKGMWIGVKEDITQDFVNVLVQYLKHDELKELKKIDSEKVEEYVLKVKNTKEDLLKISEAFKKMAEEINE